MTPRPSHAHLTVQMQSFPFRIICMIQLVTAVKMLSVYTLNSKVYTEKDCDMVNFEYELLNSNNSCYMSKLLIHSLM